MNGTNEELLPLLLNLLYDTVYYRGYTVQDCYKLADVLESI